MLARWLFCGKTEQYLDLTLNRFIFTSVSVGIFLGSQICDVLMFVQILFSNDLRKRKPKK